MPATTHALTLPAALLERGFWLYVWRVEAQEGERLYVGRTGDSSSPHATPPYIRMGQHLGYQPTQNALRKHLLKLGIQPGSMPRVPHGGARPDVPRDLQHGGSQGPAGHHGGAGEGARRCATRRRLSRDEYRSLPQAAGQRPVRRRSDSVAPSTSPGLPLPAIAPEDYVMIFRIVRHWMGQGDRRCPARRCLGGPDRLARSSRSVPAERLLRRGKPKTLQVITRFNLDDFGAGVSDLSALRVLLDSGAQIRGLRGLHAKLYLLGANRAIVTSANLTEAAMLRNHELGFVGDGPEVVGACRAYFDTLWGRAGNNLTHSRLEAWESTVGAYLASGARPLGPRLGDEGVDAGLSPVPLTVPEVGRRRETGLRQVLR